jgi:hypothetical protein
MNSTERSAGGALAKSRCALLAALAVIGIAHWSWEALPHSKKLADVRVPRELSVSMLDGEVIARSRVSGNRVLLVQKSPNGCISLSTN